MFFSQILGGAIFISVGQNVLNNQLLQRLAGLPGFSPKSIETGGATELIHSFPPEYRHDALVGYNESLRIVFRVGLILAALSVLGAFGMEWRSVKEGQPKPDATKDVEKAEPKPEADAEAEVKTAISKSDGEVTAVGSLYKGDEEPGSEATDASHQQNNRQSHEKE
jgi:hypothetical protein